jgi:hypothetical protein
MGKGKKMTNLQAIILLIEVGVLAAAGLAFLLRSLR